MVSRKDGEAALVAFMEKLVLEEKILPQLCVAVERLDGSVVFSHSVGSARSGGEPFTRSTIHRVYSMSKMLTSASIMRLVEQGMLKLDTKLSSLLQEWDDCLDCADGSVPKRPIKVLDLLTHTAGLTYGFWELEPPAEEAAVAKGYRRMALDLPHPITPQFGKLDAEYPKNYREFTKRLAQFPLLYSPGERFRYSTATDLLSYIIQVVTLEKSLEIQFRKDFYEPLKLEDTSFFLEASKLHRLSSINIVNLKKFPVTSPEHDIEIIDARNSDIQNRSGVGGLEDNESCFWRRTSASKLPNPENLQSGGGGLLSTVDDMMKFGKAILTDGAVVSAETRQQMFADYLGKNNIAKTGLVSKLPGYGLGMWTTERLDTDENREILPAFQKMGKQAGGWSGAAGTALTVDPQHQVVIVIATQLLNYAILKPTLHADLFNLIYDIINADH